MAPEKVLENHKDSHASRQPQNQKFTYARVYVTQKTEHNFGSP